MDVVHPVFPRNVEKPDYIWAVQLRWQAGTTLQTRALNTQTYDVMVPDDLARSNYDFVQLGLSYNSLTNTAQGLGGQAFEYNSIQTEFMNYNTIITDSSGATRNWCQAMLRFNSSGLSGTHNNVTAQQPVVPCDFQKLKSKTTRIVIQGLNTAAIESSNAIVIFWLYFYFFKSAEHLMEDRMFNPLNPAMSWVIRYQVPATDPSTQTYGSFQEQQFRVPWQLANRKFRALQLVQAWNTSDGSSPGTAMGRLRFLGITLSCCPSTTVVSTVANPTDSFYTYVAQTSSNNLENNLYNYPLVPLYDDALRDYVTVRLTQLSYSTSPNTQYASLWLTFNFYE